MCARFFSISSTYRLCPERCILDLEIRYLQLASVVDIWDSANHSSGDHYPRLFRPKNTAFSIGFARKTPTVSTVLI